MNRFTQPRPSLLIISHPKMHCLLLPSTERTLHRENIRHPQIPPERHPSCALLTGNNLKGTVLEGQPLDDPTGEIGKLFGGLLRTPVNKDVFFAGVAVQVDEHDDLLFPQDVLFEVVDL